MRDNIGAGSEADVAALADGLAIVADGNTHAVIPAGAFVFVRNHGTLADGLYTNTSGSSIAQDAALTSSNLTADSAGGLNALNSKIDNKIKYEDYYFNNLEFTSGTPGTRALQKSSSLGFTGDIIGVSIIHVDNSEVLIPVAFVIASSSTLYLNCYRANGNASASSNYVRVRVSYI